MLKRIFLISIVLTIFLSCPNRKHVSDSSLQDNAAEITSSVDEAAEPEPLQDPVEEYWDTLENLFKKPVPVLFTEWGEPLEKREDAPLKPGATYKFITLRYHFMTVIGIVDKDNPARGDLFFLYGVNRLLFLRKNRHIVLRISRSRYSIFHLRSA